jgi:hypothetical protein
MLSLGEKIFTTGRARFRDEAPGTQEATAKVFVKIEFPRLEGAGNCLAQVDSGAAYSMLEVELAQVLGVLDGNGEPAKIQTRFGPISGRLERIPLYLVADEGDSLAVEATFLISREWPGKTFLGYTGFLDRLRTALDPPMNDFYFGESE